MHTPDKMRYVTLKHTTPEDTHFDFMLEQRDHLLTWRISIPPEQFKDTAADAVKIFDHDLRFLTYQGPVNKGTGNVTAVDKGTYSIIAHTPEFFRIRVNANILNGAYTLTCKSKDNWQIEPFEA